MVVLMQDVYHQPYHSTGFVLCFFFFGGGGGGEKFLLLQGAEGLPGTELWGSSVL